MLRCAVWIGGPADIARAGRARERRGAGEARIAAGRGAATVTHAAREPRGAVRVHVAEHTLVEWIDVRARIGRARRADATARVVPVDPDLRAVLVAGFGRDRALLIPERTPL